MLFQGGIFSGMHFCCVAANPDIPASCGKNKTYMTDCFFVSSR